DEGVEIFGRVRVLRGSESAAIPEGAGTELHATLHPGHDAVFLQPVDSRGDRFRSRLQQAETQLAVLEDLLDFRCREGWPQTVATAIDAACLAEEFVPNVQGGAERRACVAGSWLGKDAFVPARGFERGYQQGIPGDAAAKTNILGVSRHTQDVFLKRLLNAGGDIGALRWGQHGAAVDAELFEEPGAQ